MRKITLLLSMLVLSAMVLAACGGGATSTNVAPTVPPVTAEVTEPATEMPTEPMATETAGVPVTGEINPARVSNQMQFNVVDQTGNQVGTAQDMILDLDNTSVAYIIVNAGSALGTGREVAVPWGMLQLQTGTGTGTGTEATAAPTDAGLATAAPTDAGGIATVAPTETGGMATGEATMAPTDAGMATAAPTDAGAGMGISGENVFVLQTDPSALDNAPEFDPGTLPQMGQSASGWDAALLSYWQGAGTGTGSGAQATAAPEMTATTDTGTGGTGTTETATAAPTDASGSGTGTGTGTQGVAALQGVALASDVIGSTVTVSSMGAGTGTGTGTEPTAAPTDASGIATAAPTDASGAGATTAAPTDASGTGTGMTENVSGTVEDLIVDTDSGNILYVIFSATLDAGERVVPVPVSMFQWDAGTQGLVLNTDAATLQGAPNFEGGQFPDTTMSGWNSEIDSFWQNNGGSSGSGSEGDATATP